MSYVWTNDEPIGCSMIDCYGKLKDKYKFIRSLILAPLWDDSNLSNLSDVVLITIPRVQGNETILRFKHVVGCVSVKSSSDYIAQRYNSPIINFMLGWGYEYKVVVTGIDKLKCKLCITNSTWSSIPLVDVNGDYTKDIVNGQEVVLRDVQGTWCIIVDDLAEFTDEQVSDIKVLVSANKCDWTFEAYWYKKKQCGYVREKVFNKDNNGNRVLISDYDIVNGVIGNELFIMSSPNTPDLMELYAQLGIQDMSRPWV